jgi:hypothetical protein
MGTVFSAPRAALITATIIVETIAVFEYGDVISLSKAMQGQAAEAVCYPL